MKNNKIKPDERTKIELLWLYGNSDDKMLIDSYNEINPKYKFLALRKVLLVCIAYNKSQTAKRIMKDSVYDIKKIAVEHLIIIIEFYTKFGNYDIAFRYFQELETNYFLSNMIIYLLFRIIDKKTDIYKQLKDMLHDSFEQGNLLTEEAWKFSKETFEKIWSDMKQKSTLNLH